MQLYSRNTLMYDREVNLIFAQYMVRVHSGIEDRESTFPSGRCSIALFENLKVKSGLDPLFDPSVIFLMI